MHLLLLFLQSPEPLPLLLDSNCPLPKSHPILTGGGLSAWEHHLTLPLLLPDPLGLHSLLF